MTLAKFKLGGIEFQMIDYDNVRFAKEIFRPDFEREIGELPCRDDDVFLVVYPKSGQYIINNEQFLHYERT